MSPPCLVSAVPIAANKGKKQKHIVSLPRLVGWQAVEGGGESGGEGGNRQAASAALAKKDRRFLPPKRD